MLVRDGGVIADGVDPRARRAPLHRPRLEDRSCSRSRRASASAPASRSLKIRFNSVFGYYIEVSKSNLAKVPADYIRKQTLANAERYITPELKELEEKIVGAEEKAIAIELRLYDELLGSDRRGQRRRSSPRRGRWGRSTRSRRWPRSPCATATSAPQLSDDAEICIEDGRHPVIEQIAAERFIPNHTDIRRDENGIQIITGPNMGGKSTYLRQVALIVLLNQVGSFVPAAKARLGIFDRIFTRVGASDQLARGESTFMVEMHETANILNNATDRSLIILDEVGRGTATFDGLSLAWAIIEYLHDNPARSGITLFATHYHEVTDLAKTKTARGELQRRGQGVERADHLPAQGRRRRRRQELRHPGGQAGRHPALGHRPRPRDPRHAGAEGARRRRGNPPPRPRARHTPARPLQLQRAGRSSTRFASVDLDTLSPRDALNVLYELKQKLQ